METKSYLLWFADNDVDPEIFTGEGAKEAAFHMYSIRNQSWTCILFETVDSLELQEYCTKINSFPDITPSTV